MCGIVGYIGTKNAQPILINGLKKLEYRGYDSAGIATVCDSKIFVRKQKGKIGALEKLLKKRSLKGAVGVSHSRWATHGIPSQYNAHPHTDCTRKIAIVHNGIIENYEDLKEKLIKEGHRFQSETDTEAIAHLIEKFYKDDIEQAVRTAVKKLKGSFAIGVISAYQPDKLIVARLGSPLVIGIGKNENFIASDIPALLGQTKTVLYVEDNEMAVLTKDAVLLSSFDGKRIKRAATKIAWDASQAEKDGYPHFMLKEIYEQPSVLEGILTHRISAAGDAVCFQELKLKAQDLARIDKIVIVACGTAYHAGLTAKYILENLTALSVEVDVSSEFRYRSAVLSSRTLVIAVSQSGETADTLASIREVRRRGIKVLSIVNVLGSTMTRESDGVIYTHAGPEIGVASTKAYTAQFCIFYLFAIYLAQLQKKISKQTAKTMLAELNKLPQLATKILKNTFPMQ